MKKILLSCVTLLLGGCYTYQPPEPRTVVVDKDGKPVPVQVQQVYIVRETPYYYYPPVSWHIGVGFGRGHYRGPWRH